MIIKSINKFHYSILVLRPLLGGAAYPASGLPLARYFIHGKK